MTHLQALILGIIQGLTEFFPVSSSTHLTIAQRLMGIPASEEMLYFDLFCHFGTLASILVVLRTDVWRVLTSLRSIALFSLALLPLIPMYFLLKPFRLLLAQQNGAFLLVTSALLFAASFVRRKKDDLPTWRAALFIGIAQSFSLFPGISRSGSTISAAKILGWSWTEAARFSFLLAIPAILGAIVLETPHLPSNLTISWTILATGAMTAFVVGLGTIRCLFWLLKKNIIRPFAWYCLLLGSALLVWR